LHVIRIEDDEIAVDQYAKATWGGDGFACKDLTRMNMIKSCPTP